MGRISKLNTTMGIELTFMPPAMQALLDAINPEGDREPDEVVAESAQNHFAHAYVKAMERQMKDKNVPYHACSVDPACVEVPTKPYSTLNGLMKASKAIWKCADKIGLVSRLPSFNGGGAHIHTAIVGKTREERNVYVARMAVFANQNPWLSWAFLGVVDDVNAEPITWIKITNSEYTPREVLEKRIEQYKEKIIDLTRDVHTVAEWGSEWNRRWYENAMRDVYYRLHRVRRQLIHMDSNSLSLSDFDMPQEKNLCLRRAPYGPTGTVEFRAFEMPDEVTELAKRINLCDAIVGHVRDQTYTSIPLTSLFNKEQHDAMTWRQRRDGFNAMLTTLGMDPADWKAERVQIALRMRYHRPKVTVPALLASMDAAIAGTHAALTGDDNYALAA